MKDRTQSIIASVLAVIAGGWLLLSPIWIHVEGAALVNTYVVGSIFALFGLVQLFWTNVVPSWVGALAAVWLFGSAFIFAMSLSATWNMVLTSAAVFALSVWDGVEISHIHHGLQAKT